MDQVLEVACIKVGDRYGAEYVTRLAAGVARHLGRPHRFVCYTDRPVDGIDCRPPLADPAVLPGWWQKVALFRGDRPRTLFFDLDVVITGDLAPLADWPEAVGIIQDWWQPCFNSSVMLIDAGAAPQVWDRFGPRWMRAMPGDQDWISFVRPDSATFPATWCRSYKADRCETAPPAGTRVVVFHGLPKPHDCGGWVLSLWR